MIITNDKVDTMGVTAFKYEFNILKAMISDHNVL